jgi:hypothetical protein
MLGMRDSLLLTAAALLPFSLLADIVQLKDGRTLRGKIISQDKDAISLRAQDGDYLIYRDQMVRFFLDDPAVLEAQLERERRQAESQAPPAEPAENRAPVRTLVPGAPETRPALRVEPEELPDYNRLVFQISGGSGSMSALYPEFYSEDKTPEYLQQSMLLTSSVSYPYQRSSSRPTVYAAGLYFESERLSGGVEAFTAKNADGFQLLETLTNSGRFYAGSGSFARNTVSLYQLRPSVLLGSREWSVQPFLVAGPMILEMESKGSQTEVLTNPSTLDASSVFSPTLNASARAQGFSGGLELRFLPASSFELRVRGAYASLKGSFKTNEVRLPLQDAALYLAGTAYPSTVDGSGKMRTTLTDVRASAYIRIADRVRFFLEYQSLSTANNIEGFGVIRLPENLTQPSATIHADLYRTLAFSRQASVRSYRGGLEISAF